MKRGLGLRRERAGQPTEAPERVPLDLCQSLDQAVVRDADFGSGDGALYDLENPVESVAFGTKHGGVSIESYAEVAWVG
jgi:hypothetical protein